MGKKKSKKKSSSKSKKSASAEATSVAMEGETDTPIVAVADEENEEEHNIDSNEDVPVSIKEETVSESDGNVLSEENDSSAVEPKDDATTEKVISTADDEKSNHEASNIEDNASTLVEEDSSAVITTEDAHDYKEDSSTKKNESDEVNVVEQSKTNGHMSDDDDAIFLDARSFETEGSDDLVPPEETAGDDKIPNNPEPAPEPNDEVKVEETIESETSNGDVNDDIQQEIRDGSNETSLSLETADPVSLDIQPEPAAETKVEVTRIYDPGPDSEEPVQLIDDSYAKADVYDRGESGSYDGTHTTYVDELPLFHYSRIISSGLPRGIPKNQTGYTNNSSLITPSKCSELAVVRVDREELVSSASNVPVASTTTGDFHDVSRTASANSDGLSTASISSAAAMRKRQREQALLLSSDLWFQPHSIVANGYEGGKIILTRLLEGQNNGSSDTSPSVVFASLSAELGGIIDTSGHGNSNSNKSYSTVLQLREGTNSTGSSIVDISFDASGSVLGAIDESGHCSIWEFKYTTSVQSTSLLFGDFLSSNIKNTQSDTSNLNSFFTPSSTPNPTRPQVSPLSAPAPATSMFSNFMSVLTGVPPEDEDLRVDSSAAAVDITTGNNNSNVPINKYPERSIDNNVSDSVQPSQPEALVPALTAEILQQTRSNYPAKWGPPTCLAIDPAYNIKRDKSIVVGFANGQVYLTKKGTFFQRRNDTILYQAGNTRGDSYRGIESVVWRGPLVAFADATGIKLIDSDNLTRIAHINRPAGASPSLYPSVRDVSPSLVFETSRHLLVGWGDCLMQLYVEEHEEEPSIAQSGGSSDTGTRDIKIRRTASCTMAWELDCVACDIVPLDRDHVVVLGLVSLEEDGRENNEMIGPSHDLEMQILSRGDGTISYSDSLPLIEGKRTSMESMLSARDFRLLSSFALPRMSNDYETKALRALKGANDMGFVGIDVSFDINQPLFAGTDSFANTGVVFRDPHLEWNIKSIMYDEDIDDETNMIQTSNGDDSSVDSDDYECILRPIETIRPLAPQSSAPVDQSALPPTMIVCTQSDAILSLTSTVDDAIEYSLENHKCALALSRGLRHKRQLRRYSLDDLINFYLEAVLRIPRREGQSDDGLVTHPNASSLSLRRMQLAIKAMPVLLGDRIALWKRWTKELEAIPGSLFLLRKYLPVRDPILPSSIYVRMLEKMLAEVEQLSQNLSRDNPSSIMLHAQASKHMLESLIAWGPTKVLKEFISFYKYNKQRRKGGKDLDDNIRSTEISLQRRYLQTAAGYLIFPVRDIEEELQVSAPRYEVHNVDTEDSLFDVSKAVAVVAPRVPIVASSGDLGKDGNNEVYSSVPNSHTCLEAMARLRMMQGEFDLALKCLLAIGACHSTESIESFEKSAIRFVNEANASSDNAPAPIGNHSYEFVVNLIERHELNQFLFEKDFVLSTDSKLFMPIFALIRLVGLQRVGNFLMEHCVAAGFTYNTTLSEMNAFNFSEEDSTDEQNGILRRGSLPIDKVAEQLENSPSILHWYLHLVFTRRPDFYIHFSTNSVPSKVITNLHRKHFQLYVDFAGDTRDSSKVLAGVEGYEVEAKTTPLLSFLKAALPLGGVIPVDARRILEIERRKDLESEEDDENESSNSDSPTFALELAYIIEKYSDETETEAMGILNLYLKGAKSLPLAVSYAQRQKKFSARLWDKLISYCLEEASDGTIYGELLEAAALKGADLSRLVERIPPGMVVEGLRPKLVAAVADYRMKLEIYEAAIAAGSEEKVTLMREIGHRARRGLRYDTEKNHKKSFAEVIAEKMQSDKRKGGTNASSEETETPAPQKLAKTRMRRDHKRLVYSIPRR